MRTSTFPLVDRHVFGGTFVDKLRQWRAEGVSHAEIAYVLRSEHDVAVSKETVRRWCIENDAEPEMDGAA